MKETVTRKYEFTADNGNITVTFNTIDGEPSEIKASFKSDGSTWNAATFKFPVNAKLFAEALLEAVAKYDEVSHAK